MIINGDWVCDYIVEMGHANDIHPRFTREITAKCDFLAVEIAERTTPGYVALKVYPKEGRLIEVREVYNTPGPGLKGKPVRHVRNAKYISIDDIVAETENGIDVDWACVNKAVIDIDKAKVLEVSGYKWMTGNFTEYYDGREVN